MLYCRRLAMAWRPDGLNLKMPGALASSNPTWRLGVSSWRLGGLDMVCYLLSPKILKTGVGKLFMCKETILSVRILNSLLTGEAHN